MMFSCCVSFLYRYASIFPTLMKHLGFFHVIAVIKLLWNFHTDWFLACPPTILICFLGMYSPKVELLGRRCSSSYYVFISLPCVMMARTAKHHVLGRGKIWSTIPGSTICCYFLWPGQISLSAKQVNNSLSPRVILRPETLSLARLALYLATQWLLSDQWSCVFRGISALIFPYSPKYWHL